MGWIWLAGRTLSIADLMLFTRAFDCFLFSSLVCHALICFFVIYFRIFNFPVSVYIFHLRYICV